MNVEMNEVFETLTDAEVIERFSESIRIQNERKKAMGCPIAGYDEGSNKAYMEYPDGRRVYAK